MSWKLWMLPTAINMNRKRILCREYLKAIWKKFICWRVVDGGGEGEARWVYLAKGNFYKFLLPLNVGHCLPAPAMAWTHTIHIQSSRPAMASQ